MRDQIDEAIKQGARALIDPSDFDADEPFWVVPEAGRVGSRLLWYNRRHMFTKVDALLRGRAGPPLCERVAACGPLPTFEVATR